MIVSIGVHCKEIGPSLSLVLIKMAKIWENLAALYGAKCRVPPGGGGGGTRSVHDGGVRRIFLG